MEPLDGFVAICGLQDQLERWLPPIIGGELLQLLPSDGQRLERTSRPSTANKSKARNDTGVAVKDRPSPARLAILRARASQSNRPFWNTQSSPSTTVPGSGLLVVTGWHRVLIMVRARVHGTYLATREPASSDAKTGAVHVVGS